MTGIESQDPAAHRALADEKRGRGDELAALAHVIAAQTLEAHAAGTPGNSAIELCNVATGYFMKGDFATAADWYRLVLKLDPTVAVAHQNLAAIYEDAGRLAEAEACRQRAYQIQRVFIDQAAAPRRRVLILYAGQASGNVPIRTLIPTTTCCRIQYAIDYAADAEDAQLPAYDLVFNAIGEPDIAAPLAGRLARFAERCDRPLLNPPGVVARTQRHRLPALLGDLEDVVVAPCIRVEGHDDLARAAIAFPVLARPAASHGGIGLVRCDTAPALESTLQGIDGVHYLTTFHDVRCGDGYYRKYRIIFVDRQPYVYHLAISPQWMVHYFSADMEQHPWKIDEEHRFLQDPEAVLGARAMAAIRGIGRRLDLDYGGIDFTLLPDGKVFVFEANATMLVHRERNDGVLAHKNRAVQHIVDAFECLLDQRTNS